MDMEFIVAILRSIFMYFLVGILPTIMMFTFHNHGCPYEMNPWCFFKCTVFLVLAYPALAWGFVVDPGDKNDTDKDKKDKED